MQRTTQPDQVLENLKPTEDQMINWKLYTMQKQMVLQ